ncbi:hypothetical protein HY024_02385 [Candidatus Curtissbacteria bacterium]|nr:hypothetical protein [Candidatus Curtissbacteria bacterium]
MKKLVLGIVCLSLLVGLMVWLWTLQPQRKQATPANTKIEGTHAATLQDPSAIDPPDGTILKTAAIKIKGKTGAYNFLAVYTNDSATIIKVNPNTNFEVPFTATKGLNQIVLAGITQDLKTAEQKTLTYFLDPNQSSKKVFAGSVKSIFDTLITLGTAGGDASVRTGKSTQFDIPKEQDEATTSSQIQSVRIGDFVIAFGNPPEKGENSDSIIADKVQILRT